MPELTPIEPGFKARAQITHGEAHELLMRDIPWPANTTFKSALAAVLTTSLLNKTLPLDATIDLQVIVRKVPSV